VLGVFVFTILFTYGGWAFSYRCFGLHQEDSILLAGFPLLSILVQYTAMFSGLKMSRFCFNIQIFVSAFYQNQPSK
jgi:hypothetical protein